MSDIPPIVNLANDAEDTILFPLTQGSSTERPVRSPLYGPASPPENYSPNVSRNSPKSPEYHPISRTEDKGKRPANSADSGPCHSPEYKPMSTPEWEALQGLPHYDSDFPGYEPEEERVEESPEHPSLKRKRLGPTATREAGPSRRAISPFCNNIGHVMVNCDLINLRRSCDKNREYSRRHVARIEARLNALEKENQILKEILTESLDSQTRRLEKLVKDNMDEMMEKVMKVKYEGERSARMGKQSLAYLREDVDFKMRMEGNRVDNQLARRDYDNNTVNNRVSALYDNLEYIYEKQKEKNEKVEKFMKDAEKKE